jgi:hypothetical protein
MTRSHHCQSGAPGTMRRLAHMLLRARPTAHGQLAQLWQDPNVHRQQHATAACCAQSIGLAVRAMAATAVAPPDTNLNLAAPRSMAQIGPESDVEAAMRACFVQLGRSADGPECSAMVGRHTSCRCAGVHMHIGCTRSDARCHVTPSNILYCRWPRSEKTGLRRLAMWPESRRCVPSNMRAHGAAGAP